MPTWVPVVLSVLTLLLGVSYWAGRLARALEGIEASLQSMAVRQREAEASLQRHESRLTRLETIKEGRR